MGCVGSKTRSLGHFSNIVYPLETTVFASVFMKLYWRGFFFLFFCLFFFNDILVKFKYGSFWAKN